MIKDQTVFPEISKSEWIDQLTKDLKGQPLDILDYHNEIEKIHLHSYQHLEDDKHVVGAPGTFPYESGFMRENNAWNNGIQVFVSDEKEANAFALEWLMKGVNYLVFIPQKQNIEWNIVFDQIGFEFIRSHLAIHNPDEIKTIHDTIGKRTVNVSYAAGLEEIKSSILLELLKQEQFPAFCVNAFEIHQAGGSSYQEIGFALHYGHEILLNLMESGLSIDDAAACLHFHFGVNSNYLIESAKFDVFRSLWSKIVQAYQPVHNCSHRAETTAVTGHVNKSLKDPYTNLLRQTTEALSAVNGGVNNVLVQPYDLYSDSPSELAQRMAVNISLLLAEESHIDKVINPLGGSYVIDATKDQLSKNSWEFFLLAEKESYSSEAGRNALHQKISETRTHRIDEFKSGKKILIGVNKFPNPDEQHASWKNIPVMSQTKLEALVIEKEITL